MSCPVEHRWTPGSVRPQSHYILQQLRNKKLATTNRAKPMIADWSQTDDHWPIAEQFVELFKSNVQLANRLQVLKMVFIANRFWVKQQDGDPNVAIWLLTSRWLVALTCNHLATMPLLEVSRWSQAIASVVWMRITHLRVVTTLTLGPVTCVGGQVEVGILVPPALHQRRHGESGRGRGSQVLTQITETCKWIIVCCVWWDTVPHKVLKTG